MHMHMSAQAHSHVEQAAHVDRALWQAHEAREGAVAGEAHHGHAKLLALL